MTPSELSHGLANTSRSRRQWKMTARAPTRLSNLIARAARRACPSAPNWLSANPTSVTQVGRSPAIRAARSRVSVEQRLDEVDVVAHVVRADPTGLEHVLGTTGGRPPWRSADHEQLA